jgi:hypothetical protein
MMAVPANAGAQFSAGQPVPLFEWHDMLAAESATTCSMTASC